MKILQFLSIRTPRLPNSQKWNLSNLVEWVLLHAKTAGGQGTQENLEKGKQSNLKCISTYDNRNYSRSVIKQNATQLKLCSV